MLGSTVQITGIIEYQSWTGEHSIRATEVMKRGESAGWRDFEEGSAVVPPACDRHPVEIEVASKGQTKRLLTVRPGEGVHYLHNRAGGQAKDRPASELSSADGRSINDPLPID
jgi:hypothetical protein